MKGYKNLHYYYLFERPYHDLAVLLGFVRRCTRNDRWVESRGRLPTEPRQIVAAPRFKHRVSESDAREHPREDPAKKGNHIEQDDI